LFKLINQPKDEVAFMCKIVQVSV